MSGTRVSKRAALLALILIAPVQLIGTTTAMVWFPEAQGAKIAFGFAKVCLVLAPIVWLVKVEKVRPRIPRWSNRGMVAAHLTGALIFVVIAGVYYGFAHAWVDPDEMLEKIEQFGLDNIWLFLAAALYWCTINSLLEEYFWRWFIDSRLRDVLPGSAVGRALAIVMGGFLFTVHHIVVLSVYFDLRTTVLGSVGVFIGGVTWSWLYGRWRNIYAAYISHVWADVIIFWIGYQIIFHGG